MARCIQWTALLAAVAAGAALTVAPLAAQSGALDPQCAAADRPLQDACQKSIDLFDFMAPQLGTAVAGGNAVLGQGGAFGRLGRFSVGLRAIAFEGSFPDVQDMAVSVSGPQASNFGVRRQYVGAPAVDAALALFPGLAIGPLRVGALDVIATATYIPEYENDAFSVRTPDGSVRLGYGGRLGLLQETRVVPGVAVTYLRRDLPRIAMLGEVAASGSRLDDTLGVRELRVQTQAWRVVAGKRVSVIGLAIGAGQDRYSSGALLGAVVNESVLGWPINRFESPEIDLAQTITRTNYFADLSLNLPGVRIAAELGRARGGRVRTSYNSFENRERRAGDDLTYLGASVRMGF